MLSESLNMKIEDRTFNEEKPVYLNIDNNPKNKYQTWITNLIKTQYSDIW